MNYLDIKKNRKILDFTQDDLAKLLGVSLKTVSNYENGAVIPKTKLEILHNILHIPDINIIEEPRTAYQTTNSFDMLFNKNLEKIKEIEKIIELAQLNKDIIMINHYTEIKNLLQTQNDLYKVAKQLKKIDESVLKNLK